MWDHVGMSRNKTGLEKAINEIRELRLEFWNDVKVPGSAEGVNLELEKALRLVDFLELGELMTIDALYREESCGGHFREESQTEDGETLRHDDKFMYVAAYEYKGFENNTCEFEFHKEPLNFENIEVKSRNYKTAK